jgi:isoamylase
MDRVDAYPTHQYQGYNLRPGKSFPFGASFVPGGVNFSI